MKPRIIVKQHTEAIGALDDRAEEVREIARGLGFEITGDVCDMVVRLHPQDYAVAAAVEAELVKLGMVRAPDSVSKTFTVWRASGSQ